MPRLLTVNEICERALRKIGEFSINDDGAAPVALEEARHWLDMVVGHTGSRQRAWWLVRESLNLTLLPGVATYDLAASLPGAPPVQHVIAVWAVPLAGGEPIEMEVMRRQEWEAQDATRISRPETVYVDRSRTPSLRVWPTPPNPVQHRLRIMHQRFAADTTQLDPVQSIPDLRETWNLYLVTALAKQIGNGPIRKMPADEVREMEAEAQRLLNDLEAYDAHEQAGEPRRVAYIDF